MEVGKAKERQPRDKHSLGKATAGTQGAVQFSSGPQPCGAGRGVQKGRGLNIFSGLGGHF